MKSDKTVYFIIVGWNNRDLLAECFESLYRQRGIIPKVIYIDNDSNDGSEAFVKEKFKDVQVIQSGSNLGFAKANNIGIRIATEQTDCDYVALINSDARVSPDWAKELITFVSDKPKFALVQGLTVDYFDNQIVDSTHIYVSQYGQATQSGWRMYNNENFAPLSVYGVNAAACLISTDFISKQPLAQFFDERMFMYLEDVDVATRAVVNGWRNYFVPAAVAYHMGSASSSKNPGFSLYLTFRNNACLLIKNFSLRILLKMLPKIIKSDYHYVKHLLDLKKTNLAYLVIKGRFIGLGRAILYLPKRRKLRKQQRVTDDYIWQLMIDGV